MNHPRKRGKTRGYQLSAEAVAFFSSTRPVPFQMSAKGIAFVKDCDSPLGAIAESENLPMSPRHKIDAIIAEIRAPKPAPTTCWDCRCTSIEVRTYGNHPPAFFCALCDLWLGDVSPAISVKSGLYSIYEKLLLKLQQIRLADETEFQKTLELIQLIRAEILEIEARGE